MSKTTIFAAFMTLTILVWLFLSNPENPHGYFLKCPLYWATGWQCPFCGTQRAVHHLLHLSFGRAFWCNPWLIPISIYAIVYAIGYLRFNKVVIAMLILTLLWGVVRNVI